MAHPMGRTMQGMDPFRYSFFRLQLPSYVYFEKVRILQGKKKTPKRLSNEVEFPGGFPLETRRNVWVLGRR